MSSSRYGGDELDSLPALSEATGKPGEEPGDDVAFGEDQGQRYERRGLIGRGGMGRVYAAQDRHLRRDVAMKVADTPELSRRLSREARITAQLEHPGIVAVYDAGLGEDGRPWYTMRLIRGRTLAGELSRCPDLAARLRLLGHFQDACQAVAYAHSMGIIHRDLKPHNIMVGEFGETQVADWGLARPVSTSTESWSRLLPSGEGAKVAGTARYMSPEQAGGDEVGPAADVWCLGVMLYELLAGQPAPPESGLAPDLDTLDPSVPTELVAIARRCLAVPPGERYSTADALSADLQRYLEGRRVDAHDYTSGELLGRLLWAWRAPLAVASLALLVLVVVLSVAAQRMQEARQVAERNLGLALAQQARVALEAEQRADAAVLAAHALVLGPSPQARGVLVATSGPRPERIEQRALPVGCAEDPWLSPGGDEVLCSADGKVSLWELTPQVQRWEVPIRLGQPPVFDTDGIVVVEVEGVVSWLDAADGSARTSVDLGGLPTVQPAAEGSVWALLGPRLKLLREDGAHGETFGTCAAGRTTFATHGGQALIGCDDGIFRLYDIDGNESVAVDSGHDRPDWSDVVFDGQAILAGTRQGEVLRYTLDGAPAAPALKVTDGGVLQLMPVPDSPLVVVRGERGGSQVWDTALHAWVATLPARLRRVYESRESREVSFHGDGLEWWTLPTTLRTDHVVLESGVSQVTVSPDGTEVAYALGDGEVGLVRVSDRVLVETWRWQDAVTKCVSFTADGRLFSAGMGAIGGRLLERGGGISVPVATSKSSLRRVGLLASGELWALSYGVRSVRFDPAGHDVSPLGEGVEFFDGSSSPGRQGVALLSTNGGVWRLIDGHLERMGDAPDAGAVDLTDAGRVVLAERRTVCLDDVCVPVDGPVVDLAMAPGDRRAAVGLLSGEVHIVDLVAGEVEAVLEGHGNRVGSLEWAPDGSWLVSGSWDGTLRFWELAALQADPAIWVEELESAWGLDLDGALAGSD